MVSMGGDINPNSAFVQLCVVTMVCLLPFGDYFSMDSPGAIENYVKETTTGFGGKKPLTKTEFMNLYTVYSLPNVVLCIVSGYLMDAYLGRRKGTLLFSLIVTIGQFIVTAGSFWDNIYIMYIGRFVFGMGAESLALGEYAYNIHWFDRTKLKEGDAYKPIIGLSTAFGIAISISRGATFFAFQSLSRIYEAVAGTEPASIINGTIMEPVVKLSNSATAASFGFAGILALLCLFLAVFLGAIDIKANRWRKRHALNGDEGGNMIMKETNEEVGFLEPPSKVSLRDVLKIPMSAWLIFIICGTYYMAVFPFVSTGVVYLTIYHNAEEKAAEFWAPLIVVLSGIGLAIVFGLLIDSLKRNTLWLLAGIILTGTGHFLLTFAGDAVSFKVDILLMGTGYALVASSLWPLLAYNIDKSLISTGYGLMQSIQAFCLMGAYWVVGVIVDAAVKSKKLESINEDNDATERLGKIDGYRQVGIFFMGSCMMAALCTIVLIIKVGLNGGSDKDMAQDNDADIINAIPDGSYLSLTGAMQISRRSSIK